MRRSTSLVAAVALVAGVASVAAAQSGQAGQAPAGQPPMGPGGGPGMRGMGGGMQRMLFEGITLSAAQQASVDSIQGARREAMRARMEAMRAGGPPDEGARATMMQEMRAAQEQDRQAMRALLSADQQKTFDANLARMQEMMRQRQQQGGGPGGPGGPGRGGRD